MAEADDDEDEPAPPADINIPASTSAPPGDADTAMDEEPDAPMDLPMAGADTAAAMETEAAPGSGLGEQLVQAAQDAGIDLAFLEALPEELRAEVWCMSLSCLLLCSPAAVYFCLGSFLLLPAACIWRVACSHWKLCIRFSCSPLTHNSVP